MQRTIRFDLLAAAVAVAAVWATAFASLASAGPQAPTVPSRIDVPAGNKPFLVGHATGVQIYTCTTPGSAWSFVAPRATLVDDRGHFLTSHFGGPRWQANDGSTVIGSRVDGVTVDATAIPWLLLSAETTAGSDGDRLAGTTFIQRIATTGGLAPAAATCNEGTAGTTVEIPYTADYVFWKATG